MSATNNPQGQELDDDGLIIVSDIEILSDPTEQPELVIGPDLSLRYGAGTKETYEQIEILRETPVHRSFRERLSLVFGPEVAAVVAVLGLVAVFVVLTVAGVGSQQDVPGEIEPAVSVPAVETPETVDGSADKISVEIGEAITIERKE